MKITIIKSTDKEYIYLSGIATTDTPDRVGDIVNPDGVKVRGSLKLLSQHKHDKPLGEVLELKREGNGWRVEARIPRGSGLDYVEEAIKQLEAGIITGFSVGFRPLRTKRNTGGQGVTYVESEVHEVSLVTVPCNPDAVVTSIKTPKREAAAPAAQKYTREERNARINQILGKNVMPTKAATEAHNQTNAAPLLRESIIIAGKAVPSRLLAAGLRPLDIEARVSLATVVVNVYAGELRKIPRIPGAITSTLPESGQATPLVCMTKELSDATPGGWEDALAEAAARQIDGLACAFFAGKATTAADKAALIEAAAGMDSPLILASAAGAAMLDVVDGKAFGLFAFDIVPKATGFKFLALDRSACYFGARTSAVKVGDDMRVSAEGEPPETEAAFSAYQRNLIVRYSDVQTVYGISKPEAAVKLA